MRKRLLLLVAVLCCIAMTFSVLVACDEDESTSGSVNETTGENADGKGEADDGNEETPEEEVSFVGKYYEVVFDEIDDESWVELKDDGTWEDDDTAFGTYKIKDGTIEFYWIIASEPAFSGTIEEGKMVIVMFDIEHTYRLVEEEAGDETAE